MGRQGQSYDVLIDGTKYRVLRGPQSMIHAIQASTVEESELFSDQTRGIMDSRPEMRHFYQSNWNSGIEWWNPVQPNASADTYLNSEGFDTWSWPGRLRTTNVYETVVTGGNDLDVNSPFIWWPNAAGRYVPSVVSEDHDGTNAYIEQWAYATQTFAPTTGTIGAVASQTFDLVGHLGVAYRLSAAVSTVGQVAGTISRANNRTDTTGATWLTGFDVGAGSKLMTWNGSLWLYNGAAVYRVTGAPALELQGDDADGWDFLTQIDHAVSATRFHSMYNTHLATATPQGIHWVKNVLEDGGPRARIWRLDRSDSGTYLKRSVGSMPAGFVAVSAMWANDSLLILGTYDYGHVIGGRGTTGPSPRYELWQVVGRQIKRVGAFDDTAADSDPVAENYPRTFAAAQGSRIYMGAGGTALWMYDADEGGIHELRNSSDLSGEGIQSIVWDQAGVQLIHGSFDFAIQEPRTVVDLSGNTKKLTSTLFNFGLHQETKWLTTVTVDWEPGDGTGIAGDAIVVEISTNHGRTWTTIATVAGNASRPATTDLTALAISGDEFMYRISHTGGTTMHTDILGIEFEAVSGEMTEQWVMRLDASNIYNLQNKRQKPEDVVAALRATALKNGYVSFTNDYNLSTQGPYDVRVRAVAYEQEDLDEGAIQLQLFRVLRAT